jgi:DNA invertase Pin-like site-specific DNA recombinase
MKIAIYARVSTDRQEMDNQVAQLREFASKQGWEIVAEYCDSESGSKSDRPEFQRMLAGAARRRFDLLLFWALDRLTREGVLPTLRYLETLTSYGVEWRSFTEQFFDSCGPFRDAVISIMATLAKQERIKRAERTKAGLARVRAAGRRLGRPPVAASREQVASLRASGLPLRAIAGQLGISLGSVAKLTRA